jgi:hypothetical protein
MSNKHKQNMKKTIQFVILGFTTFTLAGCIAISTTSRRAEPVVVTERVVVVPGTSEDTAAMAEIDAAAKLSFDASRLGALSAIAQRPSLSPPVQVHLVNVALRSLDFENSRMQVLLALVENPAFCNAAKETILTQLQKLSFDNNRKAVMDAINKRGALEK